MRESRLVNWLKMPLQSRFGRLRLLRRALFRNAERHQLEVVSRLARMFADAPELQLPQFKGRFFVGARSDIFRRIALGDSYEEFLVRVIEQRIDRTRDAVDVGANCGFYTVLLAKLVPKRKVIAIEPTEGALQLLRRNLCANNVSERVLVCEAVATTEQGTAGLKVIEGREEYSTLGEIVHPAVGVDRVVDREVKATTVDDLVNSTGISCGFMKIDVEGHEHSVLKGAQQTLLTHRPLVLAELADPLLRANGSSAAQVIAFMRTCGYEVLDARNGANVPGSVPYGDILCIPLAQ